MAAHWGRSSRSGHPTNAPPSSRYHLFSGKRLILFAEVFWWQNTDLLRGKQYGTDGSRS